MTEDSDDRGQEGSLVLGRAGGFYKDRIRSYKVKVDGKSVGKLSEYDTLTIGVSPGAHVVQVTIDFLRSPKLTVQFGAGIATRMVCAAGKLTGFGDCAGYVKLYEGSLTDIAPPEPTIS